MGRSDDEERVFPVDIYFVGSPQPGKHLITVVQHNNNNNNKSAM